MSNSFIAIDKAEYYDLEEILSVQKLAFRGEAESFNDHAIAPLIQTLESIQDDFRSNCYLKAVLDDKIVGSVRAYEKDTVCHIGRLFVHPEFQNRGIGSSLMIYIERLFTHCAAYTLFAAKRVFKNVKFYGSLGYRIVKEETAKDNLTFVYFLKDTPDN